MGRLLWVLFSPPGWVLYLQHLKQRQFGLSVSDLATLTINQVLVGKVSVGRRDKPGETISDTISRSRRWETIAYFGEQRLSLMSSEWETRRHRLEVTGQREMN